MKIDAETFDSIVSTAYGAGLSSVGTTSVGSWTRVRSTLELRKSEGLSADMEFTYRNPSRSTEGARLLRNSRSLFVGAMSYLSPERKAPEEGVWGRVGDYAVEEHYEKLRVALTVVADEIKAVGGRCVLLIDDNSLVDREAAWRSGIGWYGKNANILLPDAGSFFVLGSIATDLELPRVAAPLSDGCRTCQRCLPSCPTGAIIEPGVIDASRCLSWLLQAPGSFPVEFRESLGARIYGCDDCQDVCPPNKVARVRLGSRGDGSRDAGPERSETGWVPVLEWLSLDDPELLEAAGAWYIANRDPLIVRRNLLIVLGNVGSANDPAIEDVIAAHIGHGDEVIAETARWAAERLGLTAVCSSGEDGEL